jgi:hypothetical protein
MRGNSTAAKKLDAPRKDSKKYESMPNLRDIKEPARQEQRSSKHVPASVKNNSHVKSGLSSRAMELKIRGMNDFTRPISATINSRIHSSSDNDLRRKSITRFKDNPALPTGMPVD